MKHCVITGAADGIGKALAHAFGASGYTITAIDRDVDRSRQTQAALAAEGIVATFIYADLADPQEIKHVIVQLLATPLIDVLINNAGISAVGHFGQIELARQQAVLDVNLLAPLLLTTALLQHERIAPAGSLVFISSLSHFVGYPGAAVYAASKDGIASFARSLAVSHPSLHVLTVFPGPTRTAHARRYSPDNRHEHRRMPPEQLAAHILVALRQHRHVLIPGHANRWLALLGRLFPAVATLLMRKIILEKLP